MCLFDWKPDQQYSYIWYRYAFSILAYTGLMPITYFCWALRNGLALSVSCLLYETVAILDDELIKLET